MEIGVGLPSTSRGIEGRAIIDWARHAEACNFSTLGVIDRVVYDNYEPLITLAAAAAVTERIRLMTSILLAPLRSNHTLFAKQVVSLDRLSKGRLVLGLGVGLRADDYTACGVDFHHRGAHLNALLERTKAVWLDEATNVGPAPTSPCGPQLIFGGETPAAFQRIARHGDGWIAAGRMAQFFREGSAAVKDAWAAEKRKGSPRLIALGYFALGDGARVAADSYLGDYYGFLGPGAQRVAASALTSAEQVTRRVTDLSEAGCDELILLPCIPDRTQLDLLRDALST